MIIIRATEVIRFKNQVKMRFLSKAYPLISMPFLLLYRLISFLRFCAAECFVVPPFVGDAAETGFAHYCAEQLAVSDLCLRQFAGGEIFLFAARFGKGAEKIDWGSHVEFLALSVEYAEVDGDAVTVHTDSGWAGDVTAHGRVSHMFPHN